MTHLPADFLVVRTRAPRMTPEERRDAIIDAVIPLLRERGREVSTKQIAEAAGVAEGTLFRAFGDKESIFSAALVRYFDPQPFRDALRAIDPDEPTEDKLRQVFVLFRERFEGVIGFMSAMRMESGAPPQVVKRDEPPFEVLDQVFRPDELTVSPRMLGYYLRIIAFSTSLHPFNDIHRFSIDELVQFVAHGVLPPAAPATAPPGKKD